MEDQNDLELVLRKSKEEAEQYLHNWKRAKADYINLERQVARQREDWAHFAMTSCVLAFLPVYESLCQAAAHDNPEDGIVRIRDQMQSALKSLGLEPIETIGKLPDPMLHEVIGKEAKEGVESGLITKEIQRGFMLNEKVLRVAKVLVAE